MLALQFAGDGLRILRPVDRGRLHEESSGIIDVSDIFGRGTYLADVQAHYPNPDPALVEGGQLPLISTNNPSATLTGGVLQVQGTILDDEITVTRKGQTVTVTVSGEVLDTFHVKGIRTARVDGGADSLARIPSYSPRNPD